ncbi:tape measure protein [Gordonia phage Verity]|uniref:Tape measure protein n=1 Tax=Gordonia phage Verity TaxID=2591211 RepID=A0A514DIS7_9CAUD|nr:tail length tape measure protein [Gordonia phage Verity]QDH93518.1 tape measure protein [Gordonia phage Verity]QPO16875.1 tape measure protein [Gordonia phage Delrey21]QXN74158.1 tape measure protein [Gordonia phage DoctorFroggo]
MTSGGGEWAEVGVDAELNLDNLDGELRQRLEREAELAAAAVRKHMAKLEVALRKSFDRMAQAFERQMDRVPKAAEQAGRKTVTSWAKSMGRMVRATEAAATRIKQSLDDIPNTIPVNIAIRQSGIDLAEIRRTTTALRRLQDVGNVNSAVNIVTGGATVQDLRQLSRALTRIGKLGNTTIVINIVIHNMSALERLVFLLNRLPGRRNVNVNMDANPILRGIGAIGRLGGAMLSMTGTALKWTGIIGAATVAVAGMLPALAALGAALGSALFSTAIAGAGAFAAGISAVLVGVLTLKTAFAGVGEALKNAFDPANAEKFNEALAKLAPEARQSVLAIQSLGMEFKRVVQQPVQNAAFAGLAPQFARLRTLLVPVRDAMLGVVDGFNEGAKSALGFINSTRGMGTVGPLLSEASNMAGNFLSAIGNLVPGILAVGAGASQVFGPMTNGIAGAARELSNMLVAAQQSGRMADFFRDAIGVAQQLWFVIQQVGGIISAVFSAAAAAGDGVLGGLAEKLQTINAYLSAGEGRDALIGFFQSMQSAVATVLPILLQVGTIIGTVVAPAIAGLITQIGPSISGLVSSIGDGLAAIAPAMQPLGAAISSIASALGPVMPVLGQLITTFVQLAGPIIGALAQALGPVLVTVGNSLITILQALMPAVQPISDLFVALGPVVGQLASMLGGMLGAALQTLVPTVVAVVTALTQIMPVITGILQMLQPFTTAIGAIAGAVLIAVGAFKVFKVVQSIITGVRIAWLLLNLAFTASPIGFIITAIAALAAGLYLFFTKTEVGRQLWDKIWNSIKATFSVVWNAIKAAWDAVYPYIEAGFRALGATATWLWQNAIGPAFRFIGNVIQVAWSVIQVAFQAWLAYVKLLGSIVLWLWNNAVMPAFNAIKGIISAAWGFISQKFAEFKLGLQVLGGFFGDLATTINEKVTQAKDWVVEKFTAVVDFFRGLPGKIKQFAGAIWEPIKESARTVFNAIAGLWNNTVGKLSFRAPDWIPKFGGKGFDMPDIPLMARGGPVGGIGTGTSDSNLVALSKGEWVNPAARTNARTLPWLKAIRAGWVPPKWLGGLLGGSIPGFAEGGMVGGREPYGLPAGTSGEIDVPWVNELEKQFGLKASTYAGHQEKDGKNKGIDWSGPVANMQRFAEYLRANKGQVEQVIWMNPETGERIGVADGQLVGPGTSQPGYYRDDWSGHQDHVHTRQSFAIGGTPSGNAPGINSTPGGASPSLGGSMSSSTPIGSGIGSGAAGSAGGSSWGNSGGGSQFNSAAEANKAGIVPVWVENWPSTMGGSGGGLGGSAAAMPADAGLGGAPTGGAPGGAVPAGAGLGKLTQSSTKDEVGEAIYWEARKRGYSHEDAIKIISTGLQESGLRPGAVSDNGLWHGVYQQDSSYPGRDDPNKNIAAFFDRMETKRKGPGASQDMWKNIFWLQQAPGIDTAEGAYSGGRTAYLDEIQSQQAEAKRIADAAAKKAPQPAPAAAAPPAAGTPPADVTTTTTTTTSTTTPDLGGDPNALAVAPPTTTPTPGAPTAGSGGSSSMPFGQARADTWAREQDFGTQARDWALGALGSELGALVEPVGADGLVKQGIDELIKFLKEQPKPAPAVVKYADTVNYNGVDGNKNRDKMVAGMTAVTETYRQG